MWRAMGTMGLGLRRVTSLVNDPLRCESEIVARFPRRRSASQCHGSPSQVRNIGLSEDWCVITGGGPGLTWVFRHFPIISR